MNQTDKQKSKDFVKRRWSALVAVVFLLLAFLLLGSSAWAVMSYQGKIFPNVFVGNYSLAGLSQKEAEEKIKNQAEQILKDGVIFSSGDKKVVISRELGSATDPDLTREIISFDNDKTVASLKVHSASGQYLADFFRLVSSAFNHAKVTAQFSLNDQEIINILKENFSSLEKPAQNAGLVAPADAEIIFKTNPAQLGVIFDYDKALADFKNNLIRLSAGEIILSTKTDYPLISESEASQVIPQAEEVARLAPINLVYQEKKWQVNKATLASWLMPVKDQDIRLGFSQEKFAEFIKQIAPEIEVEAQEAKFKIENGKVKEFQPSSLGQKINLQKTRVSLEEKVIKEKQSQSEITVEEILPKSDIGSINDLGIAKLISVGKSNFKGSPKNRRHNIKVGSDTLNGILIKPGEDFSLIAALGDINAATGYLPELVIKGNRTIPEYGGGLCQIGTTMFRVAVNSGLPILERKNHSYRVAYYEPAGMDATIYDPKPDLRFTNDTGHYILIQTKINGDELIFEMWGTPDGRTIETENPPRIFNVTKPAPTKIIETEDLAPGEKKCTERSHNGADTAFRRKVTYADGKIIDEEWTSHYRPWQAVCLVGKEKSIVPESGAGDAVLPNIENQTASGTTP